jgi:hypothetical protein
MEAADSPPPREFQPPQDNAKFDVFLDTVIGILHNTQGMTVGLTIVVGGVVFSGTVISLSEYLDLMIEHQSNSGLGTLYEAVKEGLSQAEDETRLPFQYLHMKDVRVLHQGAMVKLQKGIWRFRLAELQGYTFGLAG